MRRTGELSFYFASRSQMEIQYTGSMSELASLSLQDEPDARLSIEIVT